MTPCGGRACGKDSALGIAEEGRRQCRTAAARVFQRNKRQDFDVPHRLQRTHTYGRERDGTDENQGAT